MRTWIVCACIALLLTGCATSGRSPAPASAGDGLARYEATAASADDEDEADEHDPGAVHVVLLYIPNRVFDLLDIVRARLRVGPGLAIGARATELADIFVGSYGAVWAGLPGPREERKINWPVGLETRTGAEVSVADVTAEGGVNYGFLEVGFGGQLLIIGFDVGVDVWSALDFVTGLVTIDIEHDDL